MILFLANLYTQPKAPTYNLYPRAQEPYAPPTELARGPSMFSKDILINDTLSIVKKII